METGLLQSVERRRDLVDHGGIEPGVPATDPESMRRLVEAVEETYGSGEQVYETLARRRDRRTRAVLAALADTE